MRILLAAALLVAACTIPGPNKPVSVKDEGNFTEQDITLENGETIHCLFWVEGFAQAQYGGMSCDWDKLK